MKSSFKNTLVVALIDIAIVFPIVFGVMRVFGVPMSEAVILGLVIARNTVVKRINELAS